MLAPVAEIVAAPPTVSARLLEAVTTWAAIVRSTAAPTAAVAATEEPDADVVADAVWLASIESAPATPVGPPVPTDACVSTVEREAAIAAATPTPPPAAPAFDVVSIESVEEA